MEYRYPGSDLDRVDILLATIGSFWHTTYQGSDLVGSTLYAAGQLAAQAHLDFLELIASVSRFDVPVFHRENWHLLTVRESQVNNFEALIPEYDSGDPPGTYSGSTDLKYGVPVSRDFSVPAPADLVDFKVVMNRIMSPSLTLIRDVDFYVPAPGIISFRSNPFNNPLVPTREVWEGEQVVDREASLWVFKGDWDWDSVYEQFGYVLGLRLKSSQGYKELINAIMDALVEGTKVRDLHLAWSAITGVPLIAEPTETVENVLQDARSEVVITDQHAYKFPLGSNVIVSEGDVLHAGDPVVDTLQFFEFNRGEVSEDIQMLAIGPGILATGYWGDLVWEDKDVDLVVEEDVDGYTKVSWELGGFPPDVAKFWDDVHAAGVAKGETIANLLDVRSNPPEEPGPASLPATINPLRFLCQNLFRYHAFVVKVRVGCTSREALKLSAAASLYRIVPPHTLMIVLVELDHSDEPIIMDGPGTASAPGYEEQVTGFPAMVVGETIDGPTMIQERVRAYQIAGRCQ